MEFDALEALKTQICGCLGSGTGRKSTGTMTKSRGSGLGGDQRADLFAADYADDVALFAHAEDHHGHVVVFAEGDGGGVHDAEVEAEDVRVGDLGEFGGFVVDLAGGGVGGEEWVAGTGGEDDYAALF